MTVESKDALSKLKELKETRLTLFPNVRDKSSLLYIKDEIGIKPHEFSKLVNELRETCSKFKNSQQLRTHIVKTLNANGIVPNHEGNNG